MTSPSVVGTVRGACRPVPVGPQGCFEGCLTPFFPYTHRMRVGSAEPSRAPLEPTPTGPSSGMDRYEVATPQSCPGHRGLEWAPSGTVGRLPVTVG